MNNWILEYKGWNKEEHPLREALCTLGNGYFATRGAMEELQANDFNYPGTYLAGGYNRAKSKIKGKEIVNEDLVNLPNWLFLTFKIKNGKWLNLDDTEILEYLVNLNLKEGVLERKVKFRDNQSHETTLISRRIVSMDDHHVMGIEWTIIPENWEGEITVRSALDGSVENKGVERYNDLNNEHLDILDKGKFNENKIYLLSQTKQSKILIAQTAQLSIYQKKEKINTKIEVSKDKEMVWHDAKLNCSKLQSVRIEKLATLFTSKDFAISDPLNEAQQKLSRVDSFNEIYLNHKMVWEQLWNHSNFELETENHSLLFLRLHTFHLYQTISENSIDYDIGIPSRGWHGEAYRGHIFWDELYIFPFLNLHMPHLARAMLMYRYRRLGRARYAAKENGYRGAMYPWQSGSNGREESQKIHLNPKSGRWIPDYSNIQRHINAAIPYNVWLYYQTTNDMDFLAGYGAEMILNTALFWLSIADYNPKRDRYEIRGVMGPDEYHTHYPDSEQPGLNNNAYTNFMAVWVIRCALELFKILDEKIINELIQKVGFTNDDMEKCEALIKKMYIPFNKNGTIMQFEGFDKLKDFNWDKYKKKYGNTLRLDRILEKENDSPNNYKACKQADVLMLFYLFSADELTRIFNALDYDFDPKTIPDNINYYQKITSHGSTLSRVIFSWVYVRSNRELSWNNFREALLSDFKDVQGGTTPEGIHLGAMAGSIDIIQRCYTGLEIRDDVLWLNPCLPKELNCLQMHIRYRGHWIKLKITPKKLYLQFEKGWANPINISVKGQKKELTSNDSAKFDL
ncbi:MAG TPA: glycosyl hydrolase family 65 protein [Bacteroidales bacterium]|nr:glycosyl hydrolase family 65 protein [Bacteroidales bacterium]